MTESTTVAGSPQQAGRPAYQLSVEPDGTSFTARENFADVLAREILGPGDGPDEVLDVVPDAKYLVGLLAPVRLTRSRDVPRTAEPDEEQSDVGDDLDARAGTGVPVAAVDDTTVDADEDAAQDSPTKRGLMMPASMGLRFQVPLHLDAVTVRASWGVYEPESTGELTSSGRMKRVFRRTPFDVSVRLAPTELRPGK
ncbi:MAG: helicase, partial [Dermatophilaceae bacterium]